MEENKQFSLFEEEPLQNEEIPEEVIPEELPAFTELDMQPLPEEPAAAEEAVMEIAEEEILPVEMAAAEETSELSEDPVPADPSAAEADVPAEEPASDEDASSETQADTPSESSEDGIPVLSVVEEDDVPPADGVSLEEAPAEEAPIRSGEDFMSRIPDVEEDYLQTDPEAIKAIEDIEALLDKPVDQDYREEEPDPVFDAMLAAPAPKEEKAEHERPTRKGRPKRRKGEGLFGIPNILVTVVWLALIVIIGVTAGRMMWVCAADVLAFGREDKPVTITIYESDTMEDIVDKLHSNGLIRYKSLFNLYASISDAEEDIKPGIYDLNTRYDYHALVNFMSPKSSREVVELTIPEGYSCQQIFALLEENRVCTAVDAAAYAANGELNDYWFLDGVERGSENCLEGYLFPDTYEFYKNSTPREALQRMLNNFEIKFSEEMKAQLDGLNLRLTGNYTIREIVIVASLIEKESAHPEESPKVAGVIYNRLFNWGSNPKLLNIDAAIVYAQGGDAEKIDTSLDHPYNTYKYAGLTPGPISNPGLASLKAALNPETHNYFYYVLNPSTGKHQFSTTHAEHNAWIDQFYG